MSKLDYTKLVAEAVEYIIEEVRSELEDDDDLLDLASERAWDYADSSNEVVYYDSAAEILLASDNCDEIYAQGLAEGYDSILAFMCAAAACAFAADIVEAMHDALS